MAWTPVGATPGTLLSLGFDFTVEANNYSVTVSPTSGVDFHLLANPIYGIPFATTEPSGDLTYLTGGGGSVRPGSGFLYPRGLC